MKLLRLKPISLAILLATVTGCNSLPALDEVVPDNTQKYRKAETMPPLDVPPDLSTSRINDDIAGKSQTLSKTDPLIEVARGLGIYIGEFT